MLCEVVFQTKPQIALDQVRTALQAGVPPATLLADVGYGIDTAFRDGITEPGLLYAVGIQSPTSLWPPGMGPLPPKPYGGRGRPPSLVRRDADHAPVSARQLAIDLPNRAWRRITWREGSNATLASRFTAIRVRPADRDTKRSEPRPEEWCLIEWPAGEPELTRYRLSTLPLAISRQVMVNLTKLRWRIERDYQDLKQELGLGHYEGRGWRGFHHHAPCASPPMASSPPSAAHFPPSAGPQASSKVSPLPVGYRPRSASHPA